MIIIILSALIALMITIIKFYKDDSAVTENGDQESIIKVLAPYENTVNKKLLMDIAKKYSELPNKPIVEMNFISKNDYKKEISMSLNQDTLADLIICENTVMPSLINMNVFRNISYHISASKMMNNYYPEMWNNTRSDGKYYGIPFMYDPYVLFWNKNLLIKEKVSVPKNWDQLKEVTELVQANGIYGFGIGVKQDEEITALFMQLLYTTGGSIREINGKEGMKVFELLQYFKEQKLIPPECINWTQLDLANEFTDGKVAIMINNLSTISVLKANGVNFNVGISMVPIDKKESYMFHGKNIGITKNANYKEALEFLDYLAQEEIVQQVANATNTIPVLVALEYKYDNEKFQINREIIHKQKNYGIAKSSLNSWFDISGAVSKGIYDLLSGTDPSVKTIADVMQDKVRIAIIDN